MIFNAEVRDGKLFIADRGTDGGNDAYFRYPCFIDPSDETIIEVRLKPVSGWSSILIENGTSFEEIQFLPDQVKARYCGLSYTMDTTDAFHAATAGRLWMPRTGASVGQHAGRLEKRLRTRECQSSPQGLAGRYVGRWGPRNRG